MVLFLWKNDFQPNSRHKVYFPMPLVAAHYLVKLRQNLYGTVDKGVQTV